MPTKIFFMVQGVFAMHRKRFIARSESERQVLALLDHPHIARVYDAAPTVAGCPLFVMEHVRGVTIADYCDRHKLGIDFLNAAQQRNTRAKKRRLN